MKMQLTLLTLLLSASLLHAQSDHTGTIAGKVISQNGPLQAVNVGLTGSTIGSSTDEKGTFLIKYVPTGSHVIKATSVGFETLYRTVKVTPGDTLHLKLEMRKSTYDLEEMVVTGTMRESYVKDSPVKVTVVKPAYLQRGRSSSNLMDLISSINGLTTQLNCGVCGTNTIRINGVEGPNTAVLIDGMPIMGALASVYGLNGISPSIIDQVEVIKGSQSTLYGSQALGGVVNIITKNPENTPSFAAEVYGKSTREGNINLALSPRSERFKGFVSGNLLRMEHYFDENNDHFNDVAKRSRIALFGKGILHSPGGEQILKLAAKVYGENRTGGVKAFSDELRGSNTIYGESIYTRRAELMTEYRPAEFNQQLRISGAMTYHEQDSYYGTEHYDAQQGILFGQATWQQPLLETMNLLVGSTIRYKSYNDNTPATSDGSHNHFIPGLFAQTELSVHEFTLLGGLRVDRHKEHGYVTAPRLSVKFNPTNRTTFRSSYGTGFRVVNVFTEDHAALTGSREVIFTEDLDPERASSVTAGAEQIFMLGSNPLTLSLDGFYTHFSNKIIPDYDQDPNLIVYENLEGFSVTRGFSLHLNQNFTALPLSYNAGFTLMDVFTEQNGTRQALTYAPKFTGSWGATFQVRNLDLQIGYTGKLVGPKRMPDNYVQNVGRDRHSPTYTTHDLKFTREFTNVNNSGGLGVEAYISIENMFDFTQGSPLINTSNPFGPEFDTIYTWGPMVGRTFAAGLRLNLR